MVKISNGEFQSLRNYFSYALGPVLNLYFASLIEKCRDEGIERVFFISREGEMLSSAFNAFCIARNISVGSTCLFASRAMLMKINIEELFNGNVPEIKFNGTAKGFFSEKLSLNITDLDEFAIGKSLLNSKLVLPNDSIRFRKIVDKYVSNNKVSIENRRSAYLNYLDKCSFFKGEVIIADVGYSGTLQKHLSCIIGEPTNGYYIIGTDDLFLDKSNLGSKYGALYPFQGLFGQGNPLLDSTMIFEVLMSASYGQCEDVDIINGEVSFSFGVKGKSQYAFPIIEFGQRAVYEFLVRHSSVPFEYILGDENRKYTTEILMSVLRFRHLAPCLLQSIAEVDDRISGMGFVQPWRFLPALGST